MAQGMGPYQIRFFGKNKCLDLPQMANNNQKGEWDCNGTGAQHFTYNPVTGHVKHAYSNQCLDTMGDKWRFNDCNNHENQRFWKMEHLLRNGNGSCLDTGNNDHRAGCDGNNNNQKLVFDLI
jgi:hypothetical protein